MSEYEFETVDMPGTLMAADDLERSHLGDVVIYPAVVTPVPEIVPDWTLPSSGEQLTTAQYDGDLALGSGQIANNTTSIEDHEERILALEAIEG
jgi:hypothetical protein